ncbi:MAG: Flagellar protein FlgJ [Thermoanaerobacterales bacterium 50_218]|nr:MAG: Flagellar protein FlgJ [Thermoanaerobacterales bacterium 50_218]HAA89085.1 hypothetical protein [Peptococcaceae bacterium]
MVPGISFFHLMPSNFDYNLGSIEKEREQELKDACQQLEALFLYQLLRAMRKTVPRSGLFGSSSEMAFYEELVDQQYALLLARQGVTGIGEMIYEQLRQQGSSLGAKA